MLDKELMKSKFKKSILTYSSNAKVQLEIAKRLSGFIEGKYENILEIGSYCGFLTKEIINKSEFKKYLAIDIIDSFDSIKELNPKIKFLCADIEDVELNEKYDLIASSSSLQWCEDFPKVIKKLKSHLTPNGKLVISIFGNKNLYQIKETFGISLKYPEISKIKNLFSSEAVIFEEIKNLSFDNPREILKHLKFTGVNSFNKKYTYSEIKNKMNILASKYNNELTYNPLYIID